MKATGFLADPLGTARPVAVTPGTVTGLLDGTGGDSGITQTGSSSLGERTTLPSGDGDDDSDWLSDEWAKSPNSQRNEAVSATSAIWAAASANCCA